MIPGLLDRRNPDNYTTYNVCAVPSVYFVVEIEPRHEKRNPFLCRPILFSYMGREAFVYNSFQRVESGRLVRKDNNMTAI